MGRRSRLGYVDLAGEDDYEDEAGEDELTGYANQPREFTGADLIGAPLRRRGRARREARDVARQARRAERHAPIAPEIIDTPPTFARRYIMPIGSLVVPAGGTDFLRGTAQRLIKLERLTLSSTALASFNVTSVTIGVENQTASVDVFPAEMFRFDAVGMTLEGNTLSPGMQVAVGLNNTSGAPQTIVGAFVGLSAQ